MRCWSTGGLPGERPTSKISSPPTRSRIPPEPKPSKRLEWSFGSGAPAKTQYRYTADDHQQSDDFVGIHGLMECNHGSDSHPNVAQSDQRIQKRQLTMPQ